MSGKTKKSTSPIVESHPEDYIGYPFITLIQYQHNKNVLAIVDNVDAKIIKAFVVDLCGPEGVNEELVVSIAGEWYENSKGKYPISIEFSKRGISNDTSRILKTFNLESITRIIGPVFKFPMSEIIKLRRRKRRPVPLSAVERRPVTDITE